MMIRAGFFGKAIKNLPTQIGASHRSWLLCANSTRILSFSSNVDGRQEWIQKEGSLNDQSKNRGTVTSSEKERQKETDAYLRSLSAKDLRELRNIYRYADSSTIKSMKKGLLFESKTDRKGSSIDVRDGLKNTLQNRSSSSRKLRHPIGLHRNDRVRSEVGDLEITFLGTASSCPTISRGVSCTALRFNSEMYLFDCGESTQLQMLYSDISSRFVNKIFITHLHGDHIFGLPAMLCSLGSIHMARFTDEKVSNEDLRGHELDIYGPTGIREYVRTSLRLTHSKTIVPYRVHELKDIPMVSPSVSTPLKGTGEAVPGRVVPVHLPDGKRKNADFGEVEGSTDIYPDSNGFYHIIDGELSVKAGPLAHSIPCVGYVVEERSRVGTLRIDKLKPYLSANKEAMFEKYGKKWMMVNKDIKELQPDESYTFPNGDVIYGRDVVEPAIEGRKIVILGDTCNSERIAPLAMNADVLIHESTCTEEEGSIREQTALAINRRHSTPRMAGQFAERIKAKQLLLTHFSRRCSGLHHRHDMSMMWHIEDLARKGAPHLVGGNDIIAAWDFMTLCVPTKSYGRQCLEKMPDRMLKDLKVPIN